MQIFLTFVCFQVFLPIAKPVKKNPWKKKPYLELAVFRRKKLEYFFTIFAPSLFPKNAMETSRITCLETMEQGPRRKKNTWVPFAPKSYKLGVK